MKLLSYGSFSSVYEVNEGDGNTYAIKMMDDDSPDVELDILPTLNHKNVIRCIELNREERWIKMPKYTMTLSKFIKDFDYSEDDRNVIISQLNDAMDYLRSQSVVHCDIKPSNIVIDTKTMNVCIIDFGLSFRWDGNEVTFKRRGNWAYMSPEVCCCAKVKNDPFCVDRFSMDMVIYKLRTKKTLLKWKSYVDMDISMNTMTDDDIALYHIKAICDKIGPPSFTIISYLGNDKVKQLLLWMKSNRMLKT